MRRWLIISVLLRGIHLSIVFEERLFSPGKNRVSEVDRVGKEPADSERKVVVTRRAEADVAEV